MKYGLFALVVMSGSALAQERRTRPDGCCIPQNREAFRAEYLAGRCLARQIDSLTCPEVYARFDTNRARINDSSLNQFGRLNHVASPSVSATVPPPPPPPTSGAPQPTATPTVPAPALPAGTRILPPDPLPEPK
jgi:hypothetical protein